MFRSIFSFLHSIIDNIIIFSSFESKHEAIESRVCEESTFKIKSGIKIVESGELLKGQIENNSILIDVNGDSIDAVDQILQIEPENVRWITYINPNGEKIRLRF